MMRKGIIIIVLLLISACIIPFIIFSLQFFALDPGNGGGILPDYIPDPEYDIGIPVLDEITPEVDYDGSIRLYWDIVSPYTISHYRVKRILGSGVWGFIAHNVENKYYIDLNPQEGVYQYKVQAVAIIDGSSYYSEYSNVQSVQVVSQTTNIPVLKAIDGPCTDGTVELDWNAVEGYLGGTIMGYHIYRYSASEGWKEIDGVSFGITEYTDDIEVNGEYQYYIKSITLIHLDIVESDPSNIQTVVVDIHVEPPPPPPPELLPSNPSIIINSGVETTDSFEVTLSLYCDRADEMQIQISIGVWTDWVDYTTTYIITLLGVADPDYPDFRVSVIFRNDNGTTEDAGYGDIYDDITYEEPTQEEEEEEEEPSPEEDYTLIYVLLGVLVGLIGIGVFLKYRKQIIKSK